MWLRRIHSTDHFPFLALMVAHGGASLCRLAATIFEAIFARCVELDPCLRLVVADEEIFANR